MPRILFFFYVAILRHRRALHIHHSVYPDPSAVLQLFLDHPSPTGVSTFEIRILQAIYDGTHPGGLRSMYTPRVVC